MQAAHQADSEAANIDCLEKINLNVNVAKITTQALWGFGGAAHGGKM